MPPAVTLLMNRCEMYPLKYRYPWKHRSSDGVLAVAGVERQSRIGYFLPYTSKSVILPQLLVGIANQVLTTVPVPERRQPPIRLFTQLGAFRASRLPLPTGRS